MPTARCKPFMGKCLRGLEVLIFNKFHEDVMQDTQPLARYQKRRWRSGQHFIRREPKIIHLAVAAVAYRLSLPRLELNSFGQPSPPVSWKMEAPKFIHQHCKFFKRKLKDLRQSWLYDEFQVYGPLMATSTSKLSCNLSTSLCIERNSMWENEVQH